MKTLVSVLVLMLTLLVAVAVFAESNPLAEYTIVNATVCQANTGQVFRCLVMEKEGKKFYAVFDDNLELVLIIESMPEDQPDKIVWRRDIQT